MGHTADNHTLVGVVFRNGYIQSHVGKRRLKADSGRYVDIKNKFLQRLFNFWKSQTIIADERRQKSIEIGKCLRAGCFSLQRVKEINHLSKSAAQMLCRFAFHLAGNTTKALQKQVVKIPPHTINGKQTQIMNMKITVIVCFLYFRRINLIQPVNLAHFRRNIIVQPLQ
ncbi:MAG: hypothetical protein BWY90_00785 [Deltaproteobacteria bacterium ADurb.BinA014]|nr:MAG: hypothetical protein BWY90_00785 [Deltaproteobacteria bacterium ADurb.BinA014]